MLEQNSLKLRRRYAEALVLDHLLLAIDDVNISIFVDPADVTGVEPAIPQCAGGLVGSVPVALHYLRAADDDLADFASRERVFASLDVDNPVLRVGHQNPAALKPYQIGIKRAVMCRRSRLCQAVSLDHPQTQARFDTTRDVRCKRSRGAENVLDRSELRRFKSRRVCQRKM